MTKLTKKKKQLLELVNPENTYSLEEAMQIFQTVKSNKFDESIDIALRLGIDPGKSDQNVRGAITLPHSLGKTVTVAVFADGDQAKKRMMLEQTLWEWKIWQKNLKKKKLRLT
jgi:large subunit ribosomal protein L1